MSHHQGLRWDPLHMQKFYNVKFFGKKNFYGRLHPFPKGVSYAGGRIFRARGGSPRKCRNLAGIPGDRGLRFQTPRARRSCRNRVRFLRKCSEILLLLGIFFATYLVYERLRTVYTLQRRFAYTP